MKVKWLVVCSWVLLALALVSLWSGWDDNWTFTFAVGAVFLVLTEISID